MEVLRIRCFVEHTGGHWEAHCLDLCISVRGGSPVEAKRNLNEAIMGYIEWAIERGVPFPDLRRSSPMSIRLRYRILLAQDLARRLGATLRHTDRHPPESTEEPYEYRLPNIPLAA